MSLSAAESFEDFLRANPEILKELNLIANRDEYIARCAQRGEELGFHFTADEYEQLKKLGRGSTEFNGGCASSYSDIIPNGAPDTAEW